jgi:hypothetical protein
VNVNWHERHKVYVNREFSIALVKVRGGYMELDDYRERGGNVERVLPAYSEYFGTFSNVEIDNMAYPE